MSVELIDIVTVIFSIMLPPVGVFLERGVGVDLLINICLTLLGYIPGKMISLRTIKYVSRGRSCFNH